MFNRAVEKGKINTIPEIPGIAVRFDGHVGIYMGNGVVFEERGFDYGLVETKLAGRKWTDWYKIPFMEYVDVDKASSVISKGCTGEDVVAIQTMLMRLGYDLPKYGTDGDFGQETFDAVVRFQKDNSLMQTGAVDNECMVIMETKVKQAAQPQIQDQPKQTMAHTRNLKTGCVGDDVSLLQMILNQIEGAGLEVDGEFGKATNKAVIDFQSKHNLTADGIVGEKTVAEINKILDVSDAHEEPQLQQSQPKVYVSVTGSTVNVRSDAGTFASVIGIARLHEVYAVIGEKNGWYFIAFKDKTGWISSKYCSVM